MRASPLVTPLIGFLLLSAGCGSASTSGSGPDNPQDAAVANPLDAAVATPLDAAIATPLDTATPDAQTSPPEPPAEAGASPEPIARSPLARVSAGLNDDEKRELATSLSDFAFALLQEARNDPATKDNFAFSPTSISLALGMVYAGARGNTAAQMKDVLHVASSSDVYLRSLNWLDQQLESRAAAALQLTQDVYRSSGSTAPAPDPANYRLHVVNAFWGERTTTFEQPYLDALATEFGAGIHLADFITQPETERLAINAWVSGETLDRINDLIPLGFIDAATRAVLVNAIHLKLPWYDPFREVSTAPAIFTKTDGSTVSVPFMNQSAGRSYAEDDTTQVVAIPLSGQNIDFVVFLPQPTSSLAQLEASLSSGRAQALVVSMSSQPVALALPRFAFTTESVNLRTMLIALGMTDAFGASADFSGITQQTRLSISDVLHKAMVGVDEHGVEAAAATAVTLRYGTSVDKQVNANRPFFFGIYDRPTTTWLFLGHVTDPTMP